MRCGMIRQGRSVSPHPPTLAPPFCDDGDCAFLIFAIQHIILALLVAKQSDATAEPG